MTEAHQEHDSPHEGPVKTPKQVILAVLFGFLIPVVVIILLASYVATGARPAAGSTGLGREAVAERIRPVGRVEVKDASDIASLKSGEQVFTAQCSACHAAGVAGAPKFGDAAAWAPRIGQGYQALLVSALKGKGAMGPQGGGDFSDLEIGRAVVYMANKGGASFPEPTLPAAGQAVAPAAVDMGAVASPAGAGAAAPAVAPVGGRCSARDAGSGDHRRCCCGDGHCGRAGCRRRRGAGALHPGLPGLPCRRHRRCAQARRQGRLGAAHRPGHRCADRQRDQGQGRDAAQGRCGGGL